MYFFYLTCLSSCWEVAKCIGVLIADTCNHTWNIKRAKIICPKSVIKGVNIVIFVSALDRFIIFDKQQILYLWHSDTNLITRWYW